MTDLTEFLLARITEDEAVARAAADIAAPPWRWQHLPPPLDYGLAGTHPVQGGMMVIVPSRRGDLWPDRDTAEHIVRHDPSRVLAECEAKRRIVDAYQDAKHHYDEEHDVDGAPKYSDGAVWAFLDKLEVWEQALKLIALPYADHADYRQEWRPVSDTPSDEQRASDQS